MRIYNATDSQISLPLIGSMRINIAPHSVSQDFLGGTEFLSMLVTSYDVNEIALIVSGPYELNTCANIPTATNYVTQTLEEALQRFNKEEKTEEVKEEEEEAKSVIEEEKTCTLCEDEKPIEKVEEKVEDETSDIKPKRKFTAKKKKVD